MKGYRVKSGNGTGYYGFEDSYSEANSLLSICLQHDPNATIEPYEYESQAEKNYRLEQENATLKKLLEMMADKLYKSAGCPWYESLDYFGLPNPFQECDKCGKEMSEMPQCWIEYFMQQAQEQEVEK